MNSSSKIIILDRDGVINFDSPAFIKSPEEWSPIPGSLEAIARLNQAGFRVVVASNQSGIGRGLFTLNTLDNIHQKMRAELKKVNGKIDGFYICPHTPFDNCNCRKPKPGLLEQIANEYHLNFERDQIFCIGDSLRDLEAAVAAHCIPVLVGTGNGQKTEAALTKELKHTPFYPDLAHATTAILKGLVNL
jgi:D-glycero-D-manno-heptose 1,7-bisphosphate phosphatase